MLCWLPLFCRLWTEWGALEDYRYGFVVPLLVVLLCWRAWQRSALDGRNPNLSGSVALIVAAAVSMVALEIVSAANPDWRLALWASGIVAFGFSVAWLAQRGGLKRALRFAPGLGLMLLSIPWISRVEQEVVQTSSRFVAAAAADVSNVMGTPTEQFGNTLRLGNGNHVGIDRACSGIRSLQAALMTAWFFGELMLLGLSRRVLVVLFGLVFAIGGNLLRSLALVRFAASGSVTGDDYQLVHDNAGQLSAVLVFALIGVVAWHLRRGGGEPVLGGGESPRVFAPLRLGEWSAVTGMCVVGFAVTAVWFPSGGGQTDEHGSTTLRGHWRQLSPVPELQSIRNETEEALRFHEGIHAVWNPNPSVRCDFYEFTWRDRISSFASIHRPDVCLPAAGVELKPLKAWRPNGADQPFSVYRAGDSEQPWFVFYRVTEQRSGSGSLEPVSSRWNRLKNSWEGKKITNRRAIEILVQGEPNLEAAKERAGQLLAGR